MSYSVCISCRQMVPCYEKYCTVCLRKWPQLKQVTDFWEHFAGSWETATALAESEKVRSPSPEKNEETKP